MEKIKWTKNQYNDWTAKVGDDTFFIQKSCGAWIVEKNGKFCPPPWLFSYGFRYLADAKKMVKEIVKNENK